MNLSGNCFKITRSVSHGRATLGLVRILKPALRLAVSAIILFAVASLVPAASAGTNVDSLKCEYLANPLGIDVLQPRLSWVLHSPERGQKQTAYQVLVASSPELLQQNQGDLWDSGKVASEQSIHVEYAGKPLASYQGCEWKVRVWDKDGQPSDWSQPARWTMGVLEPNGWYGKWLGYTKKYDRETGWSQTSPSPVFRTTFHLSRPVKSATVSIAGLGYYELHLNGDKVGDHVLDPAFTRYDRRVLYVTYDVTDRLQQGKNAIGVMLGNGWYNSHTRCVWDFDQAPWRDQPKVLLQLRVVLADGSVEFLVSNESWRATTGPMVLDGIRNGHVYDARLEMPGWDTAAFDDSAWAKPAIVSAPKGTLRAQMLPPIKVTETITPVKFTETKPGVWLFDMGQNMAGWAQLRVAGPAGSTVTMRYSERVSPDGAIDRREIDKFVKSGPFQSDVYILKGQGAEVWEPKFSYHGFRWVEVTGLPSPPTAETLRGRVVHTSFQRVGNFECSNELLNTIQRLTGWSYRSNFHGYPTDCPHREKNGWTGDAHLAAEQAMYSFENSAAYTKWMNDLYDEQQEDGNLPGIVPTSGWGYKWGNGPAWDSAYVLIPWYLYQYRGDQRILATHYERLKRYVDFLTSKSKDHLVQHGLGDWVPAKTKTPEIVTSSGYYYVDTLIVSKIAALLGKQDDARRYGELAEQIRQSFHRTLYKGDGIYANGSQTALSCALYQGLAPADVKSQVAAKLAANVESQAGHLDTGILGAKYLLRALSDNGRTDLAYTIACQTTPPSYGDWIRRGATTLWEDWGDGSSRNHIMFGDISAWFYQYLAGIQVDAEQPGFKHIVIRPRPVGDLTWARAKTESMYGTVSSSWRKEKERFTLEVKIPVGATATVYVPLAGRAEDVTESGKPAARAAGVNCLRVEDTAAVFDVSAGQYMFVSQ
jgi:alpha-L-rhamnosidase